MALTSLYCFVMPCSPFRLAAAAAHVHRGPACISPQHCGADVLLCCICLAGKTTTSQLVAEQSGLTYINVGDWVKQHDLHSGFDEEHQAYIIDEDKVGLLTHVIRHTDTQAITHQPTHPPTRHPWVTVRDHHGHLFHASCVMQ